MKFNKMLALLGTMAAFGCSDPSGMKDFEKRLDGVDANGFKYGATIYGRTFTNGQKPQIYQFDVQFQPDSNTSVSAKSFCDAEVRTNDVDCARTFTLDVYRRSAGEKDRTDHYFVSLTLSNTVRAVEFTKSGNIVARTYWKNSLPLPLDVTNLTQRAEDIALEAYAEGKKRH